MIEHTLNRQQADELFDREACLFGESNGIPEYRIVELFGEWAAAFIEGNIHHNGYLDGGEDWNGFGGSSAERPILRFLYREGLYKVVSEHNYILALAGHRSSAAGRVVDAQWKRRHEELEAAEAEEERKRQERKVKRAASRKAKEEAYKKGQEATGNV